MNSTLKVLLSGVVGVSPQILFLETDGTLSDVTTAGYLNSISANAAIPVQVGDAILVKYFGQTEGGWFYPSISGGVITLMPGGAGTITSATSLGGSYPVYVGTSGTELEFAGLNAGSNVTLSTDGSQITINSTASGTITGGSSLGGSDAVYAGVSGSNLTFKGLTAGSNITRTPSGSDITIAASGGGGTITGGTSLGGDAVYSGVSGANLQFKGLTAGSNITLTPSGTDITIAASGGGSNHTYANAIWVDLDNGNDANAGTNINAPLLLVQTALTAASVISGSVIIYVFGSSCGETLTVTGSNVLYIEAPGIEFTGGGITNNNTGVFSIRAHSILTMANNNATVNSVYINTDYVYTYTDNGTSYVSCNYIDRLDAAGTATYLKATYCYDIAVTAGLLNISTSGINLLSVVGGDCHISSAGPIGTLLGVAGGSTLTGIAGNNIYGGFTVYSNTGILGYSQPGADGTVGQKMTTNGANVANWA